MPNALDWAWGMAGSPCKSEPEGIPPHLHAWGRKAARAAAPHGRQMEHAYTARQGELPQHAKTQQALPPGFPHSCSPRAKVNVGTSGVRELHWMLGCPALPPHSGCHGSPAVRTAGVAGAGVSPTSASDAASPRQTGREGAILDTAPSGGFQSQRGGIQILLPPCTSRSHY